MNKNKADIIIRQPYFYRYNSNISSIYCRHEGSNVEVVDMLMTLFDEEQIMKNHDAALMREVTKK